MLGRLALLLTVFSATTSVATAQTPSPPPSPTPVVRTTPASPDELAAITARGKLLAEYDRAAWHGTDAALPVLQKLDGPLFQPPNSPVFYVADKVKNNWVVSFGRLNDARDEFLVFVEAVQKGKDNFRAAKFDKGKAENGRVLNLARAVALCRAEFKGDNRPYNFAILPAPKDAWWVYVMPAQTDAAVFPVGGDVRYTVSPDGNTILETHLMHLSILEAKGGPAGSAPAAMVRTALLDDAPEDSDVFFALTFRPAVTHLIVSKNFVYELRPDGQIKFLVKTADFAKK